MNKKIVVIDLDGTLIKSNSFHKWILFMLKKSFFRNRMDFLKLSFIVVKRAFKLITHTQMKYNILKISEKKCYVSEVDEFIFSLEKDINENVLEIIDKNNINILATAAPEIYAKKFAEKLKFNFWSTTPNTYTNKWFENIRQNKAISLQKILERLGRERCDLVVSDHSDDYEIMKLSKEVVFVKEVPMYILFSLINKEINISSLVVR